MSCAFLVHPPHLICACEVLTMVRVLISFHDRLNTKICSSSYSSQVLLEPRLA